MSEIKPALSPEEWAKRRKEAPQEDDGKHVVVTPYVEDRHWGLTVSAHHSNARVFPELRHAVAALALHEQGYGFTWEDVDALRRLAAEPALPYQQALAQAQMWGGSRGQDLARQRALQQTDPTRIPAGDRQRFRDLAARIAALLPPRENQP